MEAQARALNRGFLSRIERGRPWLRIKLATSIDGRSALASGESKWISGEAARRDVQRWRARAGAILTGAGTVLIDDPQLTVRLDDDTPFVPPLRVVLDPGLATVARGRVREGDAPTLYMHAPDARMPRGIEAQHAHVAGARRPLRPRRGAQAAGRARHQRSPGRGRRHLAGAFLSPGLVDELLLYVAPVLLGERARPLFDGLHIDAMTERLRMRIVETRRIGEDVRVLLQPDAAAHETLRPAFNDHFSAVAADYANARPEYPDALFAWIASIARQAHACGKPDAAVARPVAGWRRISTRCSPPTQRRADRAGTRPGQRHVCGRAGRALQPGRRQRRRGCVAQALHWFDRAAFFAECARVLKPGGVLVAWGYQDIEVPAPLAAANAALQDEIRDYWPPERALVDVPTPVSTGRLPRIERRHSNWMHTGRCRVCWATSPAIRPASAAAKRPAATRSRARPGPGRRMGRPAYDAERALAVVRARAAQGGRMFTGLIEGVGTLAEREGRGGDARLRIASARCRSMACSWARASPSTVCA